MGENFFENGIDEHDMEELLALVSELAQRYTGYESTSVSYERAQALMEAVLYCLMEYRRSGEPDAVQAKTAKIDEFGGNDTEHVRFMGAREETAPGSEAGSDHTEHFHFYVERTDITLREQYQAGLRLVKEKVEGIRTIFNGLSDFFEDYGVRCLRDTVQKGIPEFLKWYDVTFAPQETLLTLDYPVLVDISDKRGADAVYEYLCAMELEQRFLDRFGKAHVRTVLERYDGRYEDLVENICSIVLLDAIGHIALKKSPTEDAGGFRETDRERLTELFSGKTVTEIEEIIRRMICMLCGQYYGGVRKLPEYLCLEAGNLAVRIHAAVEHDGCAGVFK